MAAAAPGSTPVVFIWTYFAARAGPGGVISKIFLYWQNNLHFFLIHPGPRPPRFPPGEGLTEKVKALARYVESDFPKASNLTRV